MPEGQAPKFVKHRRLVVRNSLTELEAAVTMMIREGWDFDPDNKTESLQEAFQSVLYKRQNIGLGMYKMGLPGVAPTVPTLPPE